MDKVVLKSLEDLIKELSIFENEKDIFPLFRGQSGSFPLLPSICRKNYKDDTTSIEKKMLTELKRRNSSVNNFNLNDDWDWLVFAQHFGLKTRLLDWTSNPLTALWFACNETFLKNKNAFMYAFLITDDLILNRSKSEDPFNAGKTRVFKPNLNNPRIIAQAGWFTAHKYSASTKQFVSLERNNDFKSNIIEYEVPHGLQKSILKKLNILGINSQTLFPDATGLCNQINWEFDY